MKQISICLLLAFLLSGSMQAAASKATPELNNLLHRAFMQKDYDAAAQAIASGAQVREALATCSEQTEEGLIARRSVFGGMKLIPIPFSKEPRVASKEEWLALLKPHGIDEIRERK